MTPPSINDVSRKGSEINIDDLMTNLFTDKYSFEQKVVVLAEYEKNPTALPELIKKYYPEYCYMWMGKEECATLNLIEDMKSNFRNFKFHNEFIELNRQPKQNTHPE